MDPHFVWYPDSDDDLTSLASELRNVKDLRMLQDACPPPQKLDATHIKQPPASIQRSPSSSPARKRTKHQPELSVRSQLQSLTSIINETPTNNESAFASLESSNPPPECEPLARKCEPSALVPPKPEPRRQVQKTIRFAVTAKPEAAKEPDLKEPDTTKEPNEELDDTIVGRRKARLRAKSETEPVKQLQTRISSKQDPETYIELTAEQRRVFDMIVKERKNVFFTGAAGTGKSVLLRKVIRELKHMRRKWKNHGVAVTASTGLAACNIGGCTLHSFAGVGLGKEPVEVLVKRVRRNRSAMDRWRTTKVLIIDEVSMIDSELFDKLEKVAREVRRSPALFGGIQIVVTGDFFQLPPVVASDGREIDLPFCFSAACWNDVLDATVVLKQVHRQKDPRLSTMLNEMRQGKMSQNTIDAFHKLSRPLQTPDGISATHLYPRRYEVEQFNRQRLTQLQTPSLHFKAADVSNVPDHLQSMYNCNNLMAVEDLELKVGAQVMMIKNFDSQLVNGTLGKVVGFMDAQTFKLVEKYGDSDCLSTQEVMEQCDHGFEFDSVMDSQTVREMHSDPLYRKWCQLKETQTPLKLYPYVRFHFSDGQTRDHMILPEKWELEDTEGNIMCSREQIPLILAWALSIHKSQGQTLQWVHVDLTKTFEKGQAYVAVSRATSLEGLQVQGFRPQRVMVHDRVVDFYNNLQAITPEEGQEPIGQENIAPVDSVARNKLTYTSHSGVLKESLNRI